jgi:hypothetical protein
VDRFPGACPGIKIPVPIIIRMLWGLIPFIPILKKNFFKTITIN